MLGAVDVVHHTADRATLPRQFSKISAFGALLQPLIFYPLWISMLIPIMVTRQQIDSLYSIFILDLVFIMPAFLLVAVGQFRGRSWAVVLTPVMFILGAVMIFSLALGELVKPGLRIAHHDGRAAAADAAHRAVRGLGGPAPQKAVLQAQRTPPTEPGRSSASSVQDPSAEMATGSDRQQPAQPGKAGASPGSSTRLAEGPFRE